jgi:hypothetical protein
MHGLVLNQICVYHIEEHRRHGVGDGLDNECSRRQSFCRQGSTSCSEELNGALLLNQRKGDKRDKGQISIYHPQDNRRQGVGDGLEQRSFTTSELLSQDPASVLKQRLFRVCYIQRTDNEGIKLAIVAQIL